MQPLDPVLGKAKRLSFQHDTDLNALREMERRLAFAAVENQKATHRTSLSELDALFSSLQHRAFRAEL